MDGYTECEFKVGDKVVPCPTESGYLHPYLIEDSVYTVTRIRSYGDIDLEGLFNTKDDSDSKCWDVKWFKFYEEKEAKVENTCKFKAGDIVVCTEKDSDALEGNFLVRGQSYLVTGIDAYDKFEGCFLLEVQNIETRQPASAYEYRFSLKQETSNTAESLRNSILSLQQERVSLQEKIEQNIAQEKSLTEQLKELGFLLVESKEQPTNVVDEKKAVLYAEDIEEDMSDRRNWKKGDFVTVIEPVCGDPFTIGDVVELLDESASPYCSGERHSMWAMTSDQLKFHSRPVVN